MPRYTFEDALESQWRLQVDSYGKDPCTLEGDERAEFVRWNVLALEDELHEALQELGWKPWATNRDLNADAFLNELVDAFHFMMNLMLVTLHELPPARAGWDTADLADEFLRRYFAKREVNAKRQEDGYDGVSSKCPRCKRELSECGTGTSEDPLTGDEIVWCIGCNGEIKRMTREEMHRAR